MINKFFNIILILISFTNIINAKPIDLKLNQINIINNLSKYLINIKTMQGDFIQITYNGHKSSGKFFIKRPGLMRFEYNPPTKLLLIIDGIWIGIIDKKIKKKADRFLLSKTPLAFILSNNPDILKKTDILNFYIKSNKIIITIIDKKNKNKENLTLIFNTSNYKLIGWVITDKHGRNTSIYISNLRINKYISGDNFSLHKY